MAESSISAESFLPPSPPETSSCHSHSESHSNAKHHRLDRSRLGYAPVRPRYHLADSPSPALGKTIYTYRGHISSDLFYPALLRLVLNGVSFRVRHHNPLQPCSRIPGFQLAQAQPAIDLPVYRRECLLGQVFAASQQQAEQPSLRGLFGASDKGLKW